MLESKRGDFMSKIYCSTGVMVGRINNNDYTLIKKHFPSLFYKGLIDGAEFMFSHSFYDKLDDIYDTINDIGVPFDVIHCDKEIGIMLSECDNNLSEKAMELLDINCSFAKKIGAKKGVFHLWGSTKSDSHIEYNISYLPKIIEIFKKYDVELLIENIPCTCHSGLENWHTIQVHYPNIGFIFDTRFGAFHDEISQALCEPIWNKIKHIHISDYSSYPRDFTKIRPILHPCEGVIDFDALFDGLKKVEYHGSFTLESPVMHDGFIDIEKLEKTLKYLNEKVKGHAL